MWRQRPSPRGAPLLLCLVLLAVCGCGGDEDDAAACAADVGSVTYSEHVQFIVYRYCIECHDVTKTSAAERQGAVLTHNYNTYRLITRSPVYDKSGAVVEEINRAQEMLRFIEESDPNLLMPPATYETPMDSCSKRTFRAWVTQGTPQ